MTLKEIIQKSMRDAGYISELVEDEVQVSINTEPLFLSQEGREAYADAVAEIPGVMGDEGQEDGYCFEVDLSEFTPESEQQLKAVVKRFRRSKRRRRLAGDAGTEGDHA